MMKKALCILLTCGLMVSLSACNGKKEKMYIEPAHLSEKEENVGRLLGLNTDYAIYDFALEDGVQTMEVRTCQLTDGKWEAISDGAQAFEDTEGRIALNYEKIAGGVRIAVQSDNEDGATSYVPDIEDDFSQMSVLTTKLDDRTEIIFDREIPLVLQIMTSKNEIRSQSMEQFFDPDSLEEQGYEHVYAITVRFSQKTAAEMENE